MYSSCIFLIKEWRILGGEWDGKGHQMEVWNLLIPLAQIIKENTSCCPNLTAQMVQSGARITNSKAQVIKSRAPKPLFCASRGARELLRTGSCSGSVKLRMKSSVIRHQVSLLSRAWLMEKKVISRHFPLSAFFSRQQFSPALHAVS